MERKITTLHIVLLRGIKVKCLVLGTQNFLIIDMIIIISYILIKAVGKSI